MAAADIPDELIRILYDGLVSVRCAAARLGATPAELAIVVGARSRALRQGQPPAPGAAAAPGRSPAP